MPSSNNQAFITQNISIEVPEITQIMIIGNSDTAMQFSLNLQNIAKFQEVHHVDGIKTATNLLNYYQFSVVVVDGDDKNFDSISCSRILRINDSQIRIVLISKTIDSSLLFNLKNKGIIHAFIPIPSNDVIPHTIIIKEQATYEINQSLEMIIKNPPKFSTASRIFGNEKKPKTRNMKFDIDGLAIVRDSITRFQYFFDNNIAIDPYLLSSYLTAMSVMGNQIFEADNNFEGLFFRTISIFLKTLDENQYFYFIRNAHNENKEEIEKLLHTISNKIHINFSQFFNNYLSPEIEKNIKNLITKYLPPHQLSSSIEEPDQKIEIINFHDLDSNLSELFDETDRVYSVSYIDDENQLEDLLENKNIDVIIINHFDNDIQRNKSLTSRIKNLSPFSQLIAIIDKIDENMIFNVLNNNDIDFILTPKSNIEEYYSIIKKTVLNSINIKKGMFLESQNAILHSYNKSAIIKTMLRKNYDKFNPSTIPEFYGLLILIDNMKYYSKFFNRAKKELIDNEGLFIGFVESLLLFTDELSNSPISFSGMKYGDANIIVENYLEYTFIFFIGNLDSTNYDLVTAIINKKINEIYGIIKNYDNKFLYNHEVKKDETRIDQLCQELRVQFSLLEE